MGWLEWLEDWLVFGVGQKVNGTSDLLRCQWLFGGELGLWKFDVVDEPENLQLVLVVRSIYGEGHGRKLVEWLKLVRLVSFRVVYILKILFKDSRSTVYLFPVCNNI